MHPDEVDVLPRTGWLDRVVKGWHGCHYCADTLKPANNTRAVYDADGMIREQKKRTVACSRMAQLVGARSSRTKR